MLEKYTFEETDLESPKIGNLWMKRFVTAGDLSFRAGFAKLNPGDLFEDTYWYHEFFYTVSGKAQFTCEGSRWDSSKNTFEATTGDVVYIQKGTKWKFVCISDVPYVFFYVAIPASSQGIEYQLFPITKDNPV
jgi:mannose-6-phosphate isomerase-like protein (cupin superfamily)